jgi:hypothetical protein
MQRHHRRALTVSIYPLLGIAGLLAMSGCAAIPAINMASSFLKPTQPAQAATTTTTPAPAPDIFSALAQRLGITLPPATPAASAGTTQTQTDAPSIDRPATTTTASK